MPIVLTLLDGVRWQGEPVVGERAQALLAALAPGRPVRAEQLVERVWADEAPANPAKALQVLVSRTRSACGPGSVVRDGDRYRLGLAPDQVDSLRLRSETVAARGALPSDPARSAEHARAALALGHGLAADLSRGTSVLDDELGPLADVRRAAQRDLRTARTVLAQATSRSGAHDEALAGLGEAVEVDPDDESLLADLLRSLAAVRGAGAALERFEAYRAGLRDRLGTDPGVDLQRVHQALLALDSPVREGVHYESTALLGRGDDIRRLRAALVASRVVSILGPGGLGKTRLAHVLGRDAPQPVVHFIELVGVSAPEDLVGEVGSALKVRDSVSGRRTLKPEQWSDVRARIAQHLDQSPTLLILDNCEHIVEGVADLVAYLVATTRELRVLTTTRAPLAIAAERVYLLGELGAIDARDLFAQRAVAARPEVVLDEAAVADIVRRLDGLPLAIELAAAKVRVMSTADIARRLENRFALLRGGDRSAPDRHQTLLAVIDWSWNLLGEAEKRALRWLSVFHDGFTLDAAERVLGPAALEAVQHLNDQSLLGVEESMSGIRYRMLETVREFGRMQLVDAGEDAAAQQAHRHWAVEYAARFGPRLLGVDQFDAVDALHAEDGNLADALRQALAGPDQETVVHLLAALGPYWSILGDHARIWVLLEAVDAALAGWSPPPALENAARAALVTVLSNSLVGGVEAWVSIRDLLDRLGPGGEEVDPWVRSMTEVMLAFRVKGAGELDRRLAELGERPDRHLAQIARQWRSHVLENGGDPVGAVACAEGALELASPEDGPWGAAILHTLLAGVTMQLGDVDRAVRHARAALPVLERLGASDDTVQLKSLLVLCAIARGDLEGAESELAAIDRIDGTDSVYGGQRLVDISRAELALAQGRRDQGLLAYQSAVDRVRALGFPGLTATGLEPWVLFSEAAALTACAHHGDDSNDAWGDALFATCRGNVATILEPAYEHLDYPVVGLMLFAIGTWGLLRDALAAQDSIRLLVYAERFGYNRSAPTMSWDRITPYAEKKAAGLLARLQDELGDRRGPALREETRAFVGQLG